MEKNITFKIFASYVAAYIFLIIVQIALVLFTSLDFDDDLVNLYVSSVTNLTFYVLLVSVYIFLFIRMWKVSFINFFENFKLRIAQVALGIFGIYAASTLVTILFSLINVTDTSENQAQLDLLVSGPVFTKVSLILFSVLLAPIAEEVVFRLGGFRLFGKNLPTWATILVTSFFFGLVHVIAGGDFIQIIYYAGLGLVLGTSYHYSRNILVPILIHMAFNGIAIFFMFTL